MSKRPLYMLLLLLAILASTGLASWASPQTSPVPPPVPAAVSPLSPLSPAPGDETTLMLPASRLLCSGFFFANCSRQCTGGGQQSAFGSGCTCDAARSNCSSKLTCTGTTTFGPCDS